MAHANLMHDTEGRKVALRREVRRIEQMIDNGVPLLDDSVDAASDETDRAQALSSRRGKQEGSDAA